MDRDLVEVFLPNREDCYERLRRALFSTTVACGIAGERAGHKKGCTDCTDRVKTGLRLRGSVELPPRFAGVGR